MVFCSKCGKELAEDAYFCSKCGVRTGVGMAAGVAPPVVEEVRDALMKAGREVEKAFNKATKEMDEAFKKARDNVRETRARANQTCPNCGATDLSNAAFCPKCGTKLT